MDKLGTYDVIVIGAGHAGIEAAHAAAKLGARTAVFTLSLDFIGNMPCNPSIGGTAKGHLVREVDALGGLMGIAADATYLQSRMLNRGKGPAVHSLRVQTDRKRYHIWMKHALEKTANLDIHQGEIVGVDVQDGKVCGVYTNLHGYYACKAVVVATGTNLGGRIFVGDAHYDSGPDGTHAATELTKCLVAHGFTLRRFKTGTPARVHRRSIDFSKLECQPGDPDDELQPFSFMTRVPMHNKVNCYIAYTNPATHKVILDNLHRSPLYGGDIQGVGPRYCPSIEDKVSRFRDRERHQLFVEPEGLDTDEMYIQGMSSSLPEDIQREFYHSIPGLEDGEIVRPAYAIEYDCIDPQSLKPSLESKVVKNLFCAGQFNGSSGYEEAAAQGLMAGINAVRKLQEKEPLVLGRDQAYIGVLIDDLVTKGTNEPYRIMTSRAEYRLLLRQDNADRRLTALGYEYGSVSEERYQKFLKKKANVDAELARIEKKTVSNKIQNEFLSRHGSAECDRGLSFGEMMRRPEIHYADTAEIDDETRPELTRNERYEVEVRIKYDGYIQKQIAQVEKMKKLESKRLDDSIDYNSIGGLRLEARQKLTEIRPINLGQASRISGVSPADINVLLVYLEKENRKRSTNE